VVGQRAAEKAAAVDADLFDKAHRQIVGDGAIQFDLTPYVPSRRQPGR
jgi:hypothetical protein